LHFDGIGEAEPAAAERDLGHVRKWDFHILDAALENPEDGVPELKFQHQEFSILLEQAVAFAESAKYMGDLKRDGIHSYISIS
jgi:hypothetical protein